MKSVAREHRREDLVMWGYTNIWTLKGGLLIDPETDLVVSRPVYERESRKATMLYAEIPDYNVPVQAVSGCGEHKNELCIEGLGRRSTQITYFHMSC